jgi:chromosomal replication initiation ATPase DnaA
MTKILEKIFDVCCEEFECNAPDVLSKSKKQEYVFCRNAFVHVVKYKFGLSNKQIAEFLDMTHSNVHYIYKKSKTDRYYTTIFKRIKSRVDKFE